MRDGYTLRTRFSQIVIAFSQKVQRHQPICTALDRSVSRGTALILLVVTSLFALPGHTQVIVIGGQQIQPQSDSNTAGQAEAFKATAVASGTVVSISVYLDSGS